MSTQKLATRTQIGSHHSVADYLNLLEDMFVVRTLLSLDLNTGAYRYKKEKKYYFTDPIFIKIALHWLGLNRLDMDSAQIAEMVAHEHLRRLCPRIGFITSASSGEVDFYAFRNWAIEVKWSDEISGLSKAYKNLTLPLKKVWMKNNFLDELEKIKED